MSIQWALVAGFLYFEIALIFIIILPILSARRWQRIFKSRVLNVIQSHSMFYFYILLAFLGVMLLDAVREMMKYSKEHEKSGDSQALQAELNAQLRLFRAQRNFYISGFALFLSLVIYRLVTLISSLATSQAQNEASLAQATSASNAARTILNQTVDSSQNAANEAHEKVVSDLKKEITTLKANLTKEKQDLTALKSQAEATNKEYDRLTAEYSKLEKKMAAAGGSGDKKDD